jgi:hypothetical protein
MNISSMTVKHHLTKFLKMTYYYVQDVRNLFILMVFSFPGRTQTRSSDSHGKFMVAVIIWHFTGKNWRV